MRIPLLTALCAALAHASPRTAQIYIQAIDLSPPSPSSSSSSSSPMPLAEISYDTSSSPSSFSSSSRSNTGSSSASVIAYEHPDLPPSTHTVRIGLWDPSSSRWLSGTSVASADNFGKGFAPHLLLTVDAAGEVLGAACRGVRIDAAATRDFGPRAVLVVEGRGRAPELNRPVVVAPGGGKVGEEPEKTLFQKYWWVLAIFVLLSMTGGGAEK